MLSHVWLSWCLTWHHTFVDHLFLYWRHFCGFPLLGSHGVALLLYPLFFFNSHFWLFFIFWCKNKWWLFLADFTGWSSSGYTSTISTIKDSSFVDIVNWYSLLSWALYWFTYMGFSLTISLPCNLRGIAGGLALLNIYAKILNASVCPFPSLASGFAGSGLHRA